MRTHLIGAGTGALNCLRQRPIQARPASRHQTARLGAGSPAGGSICFLQGCRSSSRSSCFCRRGRLPGREPGSSSASPCRAGPWPPSISGARTRRWSSPAASATRDQALGQGRAGLPGAGQSGDLSRRGSRCGALSVVGPAGLGERGGAWALSAGARAVDVVFAGEQVLRADGAHSGGSRPSGDRHRPLRLCAPSRIRRGDPDLLRLRVGARACLPKVDTGFGTKDML